MSIKTGTYLIFSKDKNALVGRNMVETMDLRPKEIFSIPNGPAPPMWQIQQNGNTYHLRNQGAGATALSDRVLAVLLNEPAPDDWELKAHGDAYTIEKVDGSVCWSVGDEDRGGLLQIEAKPIPQSPGPKELFIFQALYG
ncbi:hypothetical protein H072_8566 [Dactylellina haptotyla CBS 200.50]|uniref:Ricin B lectin domain-containing protein n=1 Tax=Dactylellina haptotyla (strain CBS 200.50) TaxID=1284197 RepID=S8BEP5_DACHA|nr:hypothetical protein H072_8566 [Dactylellina haptotyla CBS 200.50]